MSGISATPMAAPINATMTALKTIMRGEYSFWGVLQGLPTAGYGAARRQNGNK